MNPQEFVSCVRREIMEANLTMYRQELERSVSTKTVRDSHWPQMAALYQSLTEEQRRQFVEGIRQVMVDTLSNVLGVLDGSTLLEKHRDYFHLSYGDDPQKINAELQDLFLSPET